jgi:hypothetical protein
VLESHFKYAVPAQKTMLANRWNVIWMLQAVKRSDILAIQVLQNNPGTQFFDSLQFFMSARLVTP